MTKDFEAKTEQEAIELAIETLHIEREDFDVEILDNGKRGLFKRANVKIRVHVEGIEDEVDEKPFEAEEMDSEAEEEEDLPVDKNLEKKICSFIEGVVDHMGYKCTASVSERKGKKVYFNIESEDASSIIIGRKGKNLDALQVLVNVFAGNFDSERKIIIDSEGYRERHEDQIVKSAFRVAQQVKKTGRSRLLEPMNPYERRLIHTALNDVTGIETKSEGEGLYKQVRILCKKSR